MHFVNRLSHFVLIINLAKAKVPIYSIDKSIINNTYIYLLLTTYNILKLC